MALAVLVALGVVQSAVSETAALHSPVTLPVRDGSAPSTRPIQVLDAAGVDAAGRSTLKVENQSCRGSGSGWVFAPGYVATNAHVVAGAQGEVVLRTRSGDGIRGRVVAYHPEADVAVVRAVGLDAPALRWTSEVAPDGLPVAVIGYPGGGPYAVETGTVQGVATLTVLDPEQEPIARGRGYQVTAVTRPGNSGGPLVGPGGDVYGMVSTVGGGVLGGSHLARYLVDAPAMTAPVATGRCGV